VEVTRQDRQARGEAESSAGADQAQPRPRARDLLAATVQHTLLAGFAAVAAGISAQGLTGFARDNMALAGPWPYLLFFALDGAAGVCAVLLLRRAARAETALAPRLAVWGLVAASAAFNWAHAPHHPAARQAFALMPVIAATLFEFSLRETARQTPPRGGPPGPAAGRAGLAAPDRNHPGAPAPGRRPRPFGRGRHLPGADRARRPAAAPVTPTPPRLR